MLSQILPTLSCSFGLWAAFLRLRLSCATQRCIEGRSNSQALFEVLLLLVTWRGDLNLCVPLQPMRRLLR
ncbi:hypothetical protein QOT17_015424 [Balamuthia mandrillaris]